MREILYFTLFAVSLIAATIAVIFVVNSLEQLKVKLPNGMILGRKVLSNQGKTFYSFQSIPYAAPPVGNLRFMAPTPPKDWDGVRDGTYLNVTCYQVPFDLEFESEDCLYLNVYTPELPRWFSRPSLPVMFYIYGGGFVQGDSLERGTGPHFLIDQEVIVVTINYRVGPFGFLATQDLVIPGNNGLKDQQFALKWTYDHIHLFGGDPKRITIFGESAGSASVTYQFLNRKNEGIFRGAILQSGSFLNPWSFQRKSREVAFGTAVVINDTFKEVNDSRVLLQFLQNVPAKDLDIASATYTENVATDFRNRQIFHGYLYAPVIEPEHPDAFLTDKMFVRLRNNDIIKVPVLVGITSEEMIVFALYSDTPHVLQTLDQNPDWLVPNNMGVEDNATLMSYGERIKRIYTGGAPLVDNLGPAIRYFSDHAITRSVIKFAELYSRLADTYFYQFSYDGMIGNFSAPDVEGAGKVVHGEDLPYIWNMQSDTYNNTDLTVFPDSDVITLHRIQRIWTNVAKYLNPTPSPSSLLQNISWPRISYYDTGDFLYVDINEDLSIRNFPKKEAYFEWNETYASLGHEDFDTW